MKNVGATFDTLVTAAERYIEAMALAPHSGDPERQAARAGLEEVIRVVRLARKRDEAMAERRELLKRQDLRNADMAASQAQRPLSEIYAEKEGIPR